MTEIFKGTTTFLAINYGRYQRDALAASWAFVQSGHLLPHALLSAF
jgi:hypothetical protein